MTNEKQDKRIVSGHVISGIAGGIGMGAILSLVFGETKLRKSKEVIADELLHLYNSSVSAGKTAATNLIRANHGIGLKGPPPALSREPLGSLDVKQIVDAGNRKEWILDHVRGTPEVQRLEKTAERLGQQIIVGEKYKAARWYKKPLIAFEAMTSHGKVGLGIVATASAIGAACLYSRGRTVGESHSDRLARERASSVPGDLPPL